MNYPLPTELISVNQTKLDDIDTGVKDIYRLITFSRDHFADDLLDRFLSANNSLAQLLSIKNAQMEAETEEELAEYLEDLNSAIAFVINEINGGRGFQDLPQLFQLFRLISPYSHGKHPNKFRQSLVQIGEFYCPSPHDIPALVGQTFENMSLIDHPVLRAIYFHHEMIRIHPFVDGNGRTIRIAKNWMLMYELYPPIFIKNETEKHTYIRTLADSFQELDRNPHVWNEATALFFHQELDRIKRSSQGLLEDLQRLDR